MARVRRPLLFALAALVVAASADGGAGPLGARPAARTESPPDLEHLVFLTGDLTLKWPGCDAISIVDARRPEAAARLDYHVSPGRLAVAPGGGVVVAGSANRIPQSIVDVLPPEEQIGAFLHVGRWDGSEWVSERPIHHPSIAQMSAVAMLADADSVLIGTSAHRLLGVVSAVFDPPQPVFGTAAPFGIGRFRLSTARDHPDSEDSRTLTWDARRALPGVPGG